MGVFVSGLPLGGGSTPPSGPAGGVLSGTYPNPNLDVPEAIDQLQLGDAAFDDIGTTAGTVAAGDLGLTTNGDQIVRLAGAPSRVAIGTAGQAWRANATPLPEWINPTFTCLAAELATTYAPSAVLQGLVAYTTDGDAAYECVQTAALTYVWKVIWYNREMPGGATSVAWWRLQEAAGTTSFANSGTGGAVPLAATTSGSGAAVFAGTGCGPWGQPCVSLSQSASGAAYLESASGVIEPAFPMTFSVWIRAQGTSIGAELNSRYGKKYIAAYTPITNAVGFTVLAVTSTSGPYGAGSAVCVGGVVTFTSSVRGVIGGGWSLLTMTYDGTTQTCYVNGRTSGGTAQSGAIDYGTGSGRTWYFGSSPIAATDRLNGQLSEIRVVGSAWSAATVLEAYQRGVGVWQG